ncbi:MAG: hypothetical protein WCG26_15170 [Chloroflexales bacterium]|jgi:hypothetical protein
MNNNQHPRPFQVTLAASLLLLYWAFGLLSVLHGHHPPHNWVSAAVFLTFFGSLLLCIWLVAFGISWARWLFVAWFTSNYLFAPWSLQHSPPPSAMDAVFPSVQLLLQLLALVLLFLPTANRWFRRRAEAAYPNK